MPIAVIAFDFDPLLRIGDAFVVRWQTVALAVAIAAVLVATGLFVRGRGLRPDDLLSIVIGAVPGAVVAGRIGFLVAHPETFPNLPDSLWDISIGGLELATGVVGGLLTASVIVRLFEGSIREWAHLAAVPLLVTIGAGKLAMVLAGSGQGLPSNASFATAFLGDGPWSSLAPAMPSHPSQAYEGIATLVLAVVLVLALAYGAFGRRDGRVLLVALAGWAAIRAAVSLSWRDPVETGALPPAGWIAAAVAGGALVLLVAVSVMGAGRRRAPTDSAPDHGTTVDEPAWPDPETRPKF